MRPQAVKNFEILALISIGVGLLQLALTWQQQVRVMGAAGALIVYIMMFAISLGLMLWVSRKGSNFARWFVVVLFALSLILLIPTGLEIFGRDPATAALTPIQIVLNFAAIIFLYTSDAQPWFQN